MATTDGMKSNCDDTPPPGMTHAQKMGIQNTPQIGMTHSKMGIPAERPRKSWSDAQCNWLRGAIRSTSASPCAIAPAQMKRLAGPKGVGRTRTEPKQVIYVGNLFHDNLYLGEASCMTRTATGNQKGISHPPTGPVKGIPLHKTHNKMGDVEQVAFIAHPPALSPKGPLGAHYTTENASKATPAKDAERPPDTRRGLYHGPAVKVGYPLALLGPQDQEQNQDNQDQDQDQDRGRAGNPNLRWVHTVDEAAEKIITKQSREPPPPQKRRHKKETE